MLRGFRSAGRGRTIAQLVDELVERLAGFVHLALGGVDYGEDVRVDDQNRQRVEEGIGAHARLEAQRGDEAHLPAAGREAKRARRWAPIAGAPGGRGDGGAHREELTTFVLVVGRFVDEGVELLYRRAELLLEGRDEGRLVVARLEDGLEARNEGSELIGHFGASDRAVVPTTAAKHEVVGILDRLDDALVEPALRIGLLVVGSHGGLEWRLSMWRE
ncbi:hypothetical protein OAO87_01575 [bacterium]|nr:hypothetical protein [bacterium]